MYNSKYIIPAIIAFVAIFSAPFWLNIGSKAYVYPEVVLPKGEGMAECVEPIEFMRKDHMTLLNTWRDEALRNNNRVYTSTTGKKWEISLQNTCMTCHTNFAEFCDKCHLANSVTPYCWNCHVLPQGNN